MQEIINRISNLSIEENEDEIETLLIELKGLLIQNQNVSQSILNTNFIKTLENWVETDTLTLACCDILDMSLSQYKLYDSESFRIIDVLLKSKPLLAKIAVKKLQHELNGSQQLPCVPKSTVLLLIKCLNSEHVNIGPPIINILINTLSDNFLEDSDIKHQLACLESSNSEVKCRVYDVCVGIAIKQFSSFEKVRFILDNGMNEIVSGNDILLQLNLLEIYKKLCLRDYGFSYFESKGVVRILANKLERINDNPLDQLLVPGLINFFGNITVAHPQKIIQEYATLFELLFNCVFEGQLSTLYSALDTIGYLSKTNECKKIIDQQFGEKFGQILSHIYNNISNYPSDAKLRAFWCLENAFSMDSLDNQITRICEKWGFILFGGSNDFSSLLNFCKTPFDDLSQAAFSFLKSISIHDFGKVLISKSAGFIEFLLDRKIGASFELKQKKFEIIEILSRSNIFDGQTIAQFSKYVREGVNFVEPMSEVSFESS